MEAMVTDATEQGATVVTGGRKSSFGECFFEPTILTNVGPGMMVVQDEIFGPIAAIQSFETDDEVVARANDTKAGLAGYFYSQDLRVLPAECLALVSYITYIILLICDVAGPYFCA